jgi:ATP-dependent protease ClpP protease subunit
MSAQVVGKAYISAFAPHIGTVRLEGPVDTHSSAALCDVLDILLRDYRYNEARLEFESPGGDLNAMRQIQRAIQKAKAEGVVVQTHTHGRAASAAAMLLSMGTIGQRSINPEAHLLYHHSRMMAPQGMPLTAEMAGSAQEQIDRCDRWLLDSLQKELCQGAGGPAALVNLIVERSQRMLARYDVLVSDLYVVPPSAAQQRAEKQTLKQLVELQAKSVDAAVKAHGSVLRKLFDRDRSINCLLAYAMLLIDKVEHIDLERSAQPETGDQDHDEECASRQERLHFDHPRQG